jgi:chromosome segregation protein
MEEVIFQGSSARRAVNVAEVSLHFSNEDGVLPVAFQEVVITRRLSRSGESEYFLNRVPCRLRDIADLLRGTGLGGDTGVVIESKMIDALLSDRPDDRRELFEEAAGVALYRDRRRSTERRLEETTIDLARLDDLIGEVQSQVRSLSRQRKKAERHVELNAQRFNLELTLASRDMASWRDELARLEVTVAAQRARAPEAERDVTAAEAAREGAYAARGGAETRRGDLARSVNMQQQDVMRLESELRVAEERHRNARRLRAEEERRQGEQLNLQLGTDREQALSARSGVEAEVEEARRALAARQTAEEQARVQVAAARAAFDELERSAAAARDDARRVALDRESADQERGELSGRASAAAAEHAQHDEARAAATAELRGAEKDLDEATARALGAAAGLSAARAHADQARTRDASARGALLSSEEQLAALQGKSNALEALERDRVGLAPATARLLEDRASFGEGAIIGPLSDFITAGAQSATLIERFLGNTVHAVLVRDRAVADAVREWHARVNPGSLLLLPLDGQMFADMDRGTLAARVDVAEIARTWVKNLLGHVHATDDGAAFVDARGAMWLPGDAGGPGPLRRRAELGALREQVGTVAAARDAAQAQAESARAALDAAERAVSAATDAADTAQHHARDAADARAAIELRARRHEKELATTQALAARIAERHAELGARLTSLESEAARAAASIAERAAALDAARDALAAAEKRQDAAREDRTRWQVEQAQAEGRLQVALDRERRLATEVATADQRVAALAAELAEIQQADRELAARMTEWQVQAEARRAALAGDEKQLKDAEHAVRDADTKLQEIEHALDAARHAATALADALHQAELRYTELSGRRTAIRERLEAEWRRPLDDMFAQLAPVDMDDETLRAEVGRLRDELEAIGPVNALAVEEHDEELKRLEYLTTQRTDLVSAKNSLHQAIREIDATAQALFLETFAQVRENFRQIFLTLFGGGDCELRLEDPDRPLECDIEIHASPRGKRTQRIHLLSSGERALVALSLLFGIFLTKPSPFCLMDEVDAPLDDANVGRFVKMLNQFKTKTQFIVITHNPRTTTAAADAVYGVTMQEPGVSSFVSVRMRGEPVDETIDVEATAKPSDPRRRPPAVPESEARA